MGTEFLGDNRPPHEFGDGEEFKQLCLRGDESVAGIGMDAVEEVRLLVVVVRENNVVNHSLENLKGDVRLGVKGGCGELTACSCSGLFSTDSVSRTCR